MAFPKDLGACDDLGCGETSYASQIVIALISGFGIIVLLKNELQNAPVLNIANASEEDKVCSRHSFVAVTVTFSFPMT